MGRPSIFSENELEIIKNYYETESHSFILQKLPKLNWPQIRNKGIQLGLSRSHLDPKNNFHNNFIKLLEDKPTSLYYIGLFLADGAITEKSGQISFSSTDLNHILKLKEFLGVNKVTEYKNNTYKYKNEVIKSKNSYKVSIADRFHLKEFLLKYGIKYQKTYNPPNYKKFMCLEKDLFLSMLVGYIDGDGTYYKVYNRNKTKFSICFQLHVHSSWLSFLTEISEKLDRIYKTKTAKPKIGKDGYCIWRLFKKDIVKDCKNIILKYDLPILNRKWENVLNNLGY